MTAVLYKNLDRPGEIIAKRRTELGLTQTEISRKMGYKNPNFISMIEKLDDVTGEHTTKVPIDRAVELAELLEMDPAWFLKKVIKSHYPRTAEFLFAKSTLEALISESDEDTAPAQARAAKVASR